MAGYSFAYVAEEKWSERSDSAIRMGPYLIITDLNTQPLVIISNFRLSVALEKGDIRKKKPNWVVFPHSGACALCGVDLLAEESIGGGGHQVCPVAAGRL
jgi:hypothetical protein